MTPLRTSCIFICLLIARLSFSQAPDNKEVETAIQTIAALIDRHYVFPQKGKEIRAHLLAQYRKGAYAGLGSWKAFDSVVTKSLQGYSNDGHLYVGYDPRIVNELRHPPKEEQGPDTASGMRKAKEGNFGFKEAKILDGNTGYLKVDKIDISAESLPTLFAAMRWVSNTNALIIDLRNNGGGGGDIGPVFESFFLPKNVPLLEFKTREGSGTVERTVGWLTEKRYDKPLYILVNKKTASAAEAFAYALQFHKRAVVVGEGSAGAANMNSWYPVNDHLYVSVSTASPAIPGTEKNWERNGIKPDVATKPGEDLETVLRQVK